MKRHGDMISVDDRYGMLQEYEFIYISFCRFRVCILPSKEVGHDHIKPMVKFIARTLDV